MTTTSSFSCPKTASNHNLNVTRKLAHRVQRGAYDQLDPHNAVVEGVDKRQRVGSIERDFIDLSQR